MIDFEFFEVEKTPIKHNLYWIKKIISAEKKVLGKIVFVFCNDAYLLKKNIQFLNHNTLTDVITFDYCNGKKISGDILISIERIKENSKIYNVTFLNELDRVMVHGLLHLLGYNDKTVDEKKIMRSKENFYLSIK